MGAYLGSELLKLQKDFPQIGDVRQAGLHIGVELVKDPETKVADGDLLKAVRSGAMDRGVIFGVGGMLRKLKVKPPFIIKKEECNRVVEVIAEAIKASI